MYRGTVGSLRFLALSAFCALATAQTDDADRIAFANRQRWGMTYGTNPPALTELRLYDPPQSDVDRFLRFVTACSNLTGLTMVVPEDHLHLLTNLTQLKSLDLYRSTIKSDSLETLSCMTSLRTLDLSYSEVSSKAFKALDRLDQLTLLRIPPEMLLSVQNQDVLRQMKSLQRVGLRISDLLQLSKEQRRHIGMFLTSLKVEAIDDCEAPICVEKVEPHPAHVPRYGPVRLAIAIFVWQATPWYCLFLLTVVIALGLIRDSPGERCRRFSDYIPRVAQFGHIATLAIVLCLLAILYPRRPFQAQVSAEAFWGMVTAGHRGTNSTIRLPEIAVGNRYCFFTVAGMNGWGGKTLCAVPTDELVATFPAFLTNALNENLVSEMLLSALVDRNFRGTNRVDLPDETKRYNASLIGKREQLRQYLLSLDWKRLTTKRHLKNPSEYSRRIGVEDAAIDWERRVTRYWLTGLFEVVFFSVVVTVLWLPLLYPRLRKWTPVILAAVPVLLATPYHFGYCWLATSQWGAGGQGVLYPAILDKWSFPLCFGPFVRWFYDFHLPSVLAGLNQPSDLSVESFIFPTDPTGVVILAAAIGGGYVLLARKIQKKWKAP